MTDHDPMCLWGRQVNAPADCEECARIDLVRADERERIAADAERFIAETYRDGPRSGGVILHKWLAAQEIAARIARNGGRDE